MVKLKHNSKNVDRSKDFTAPKPGAYAMKIESCTYEKEKERKVFVVRQTENDEEGNGKGYGFWDYVADHVDWKMDQYLQAIGIDTESAEEVEYDTKDFVGVVVRGRVVEDFYDGDYRPKLGKVFPMVAEEEDEDGWEEDAELPEEDEPEEVEEPADLKDYGRDEVIALGESADAEDPDAIEEIDRLANEAGISSDDYETWGEVAEAVAKTMVPKKKKAAAKAPAKKKAAAKKAAAAPAPEPAGDADDDYDEWSTDDLKAECEARELAKGGSKAALIARLRANDADPF